MALTTPLGATSPAPRALPRVPDRGGHRQLPGGFDIPPGTCYRLDRQGTVQAQYEMVAGLEDLTFDEAGRLWGMSESGTRKYLAWETRFPYIFQIDTGKQR